MSTIISVEIKMAICAYPAPEAKSEAARGNATKPGIKVTQPTAAAITMPNAPESVPRSLEIVCVSKKVRIKPIKSKIARTDGNIFSKDRHYFFSTSFVFDLSFTNEINSPNIAVPYKIFVNILIYTLHKIFSLIKR